MRGRSELQAGAVMLLGSAAGLLALGVWGTSTSPRGSGVVFTSHGFASAVVGILLVGVFAIGAALLVLGTVLRLIQRARDERIRDTMARR